ncbi:MBL fold metallo-hydrolase [Streptomyces sp. NPDC089424]|uniref:MBL fold metallo-hydrolase n=1 Tax=Streptomyces sp. NPDC089424 TaxID=3365917 RepID=UPI0038187776
MRVVLLGTAAEGGFPRWNCGCAPCAAARDGKLPSRTQEAAAVTGNNRDWWLLNASPDIRAQLTTTSALWPAPGPRATPVRGVLLTDAEPEHVGGLTELRGGPGLKVYAAPPVLTALTPARAMVDRYEPWEWCDSLTAGGFVLSGGLVVTAHPVGASAPSYLPRRTADESWVTAYRIEDLATGGVLVYAPRLSAPGAALKELLAGADCAVLDSGCLLTGGEAGTAPAAPPGLRRVPTRLHDASPLLDPASAACAQEGRTGVEVLADGAEFVL